MRFAQVQQRSGGPWGPQGPHAPQGAFLGPLGPQGPLRGHRGTQGEPPEPPGGSPGIFGKTRILARNRPPATDPGIWPRSPPDWPRSPQNWPRSPQNWPRSPQDCPRSPQDCHGDLDTGLDPDPEPGPGPGMGFGKPIRSPGVPGTLAILLTRDPCYSFDQGWGSGSCAILLGFPAADDTNTTARLFF